MLNLSALRVNKKRAAITQREKTKNSCPQAVIKPNRPGSHPGRRQKYIGSKQGDKNKLKESHSREGASQKDITVKRTVHKLEVRAAATWLPALVLSARRLTAELHSNSGFKTS